MLIKIFVMITNSLNGIHVLKLFSYFLLMLHQLLIKMIPIGLFIFFINNIEMIMVKHVMHQSDLLRFIFIMLIQINNDQELGKKNKFFVLYWESLCLPVSQVLILPPYQRKGHGRRLLTAIYNDLRKDSRVQDITGMLKYFRINRKLCFPLFSRRSIGWICCLTWSCFTWIMS